MLKKRFTIVSIMMVIVFAMMLIIDFTHSMKEEEQMSEDLIQEENVDVNLKVDQELKDNEC